MAGSRTSARPIETRCISPPDKLGGLVVQLMRDMQHLGHCLYLPRDLCLGSLEDRGAQGKGQIVPHGQMRIKRVLLEHHRHIALRGRFRVDGPPTDDDVALVLLLKTRNQAQGRGLARTGRTQKNDKASIRERSARHR